MLGMTLTGSMSGVKGGDEDAPLKASGTTVVTWRDKSNGDIVCVSMGIQCTGNGKSRDFGITFDEIDIRRGKML